MHGLLKWRQSLKGPGSICPLWPPLFFFCCLGSRCRWRRWQSGWAVDYTRRLNWAEARHPVLPQHRRRLKSPRAVDFFTSEDAPLGAVKWWSILCLRALFNTNMTVAGVCLFMSGVQDMAAYWPIDDSLKTVFLGKNLDLHLYYWSRSVKIHFTVFFLCNLADGQTNSSENILSCLLYPYINMINPCEMLFQLYYRFYHKSPVNTSWHPE